MRKQNTFRMPNQLICENQLTLSARKLAAVLYARSNPMGYCHKSLAELAELAGCSVSTVRRATQELERTGWITSSRTYVWKQDLGRRVYGRMEYRLTPLPKRGWTQIPRGYVERNTHVTPAAFVVGLYLYAAAGNRESRAYPSISKIAAAIGVAQRTVCRALHQIRCLKDFLVTHCRRTRGDFTSNNYHLCVVLSVAEPADAKASVCVEQRTTGVGEGASTRVCAPLRAFILRLRTGLHKLFSKAKVMTNSANIVKTQIT